MNDNPQFPFNPDYEDEFFNNMDASIKEAYRRSYQKRVEAMRRIGMTLYYRKKRITMADHNYILNWYDNYLALGGKEGGPGPLTAKDKEWDNKYGWVITKGERNYLLAIRRKEINFRCRYVENYYGEERMRHYEIGDSKVIDYTPAIPPPVFKKVSLEEDPSQCDDLPF